jgi:hypothetical protein
MELDKNDNFNLMNEIGEADIELDNYLQESKLIMDSWEKKNEEYLIQKYKNFHLTMQTFLKFYLMSLNLSLNRNKENWTKKEAWLTGINTVTFWRFRASYLIFKKGFPVESISLLRGIFENILTINALLRDIVNTENVFVDLPPNIDLLNMELVAKELTNGTINLNKKVRNTIIGNKSPLSPETRNFFEIVFRIMHNSTHRSMINIIKHVFPWYQGKKILSPLPLLEDEHLRLYINLSLYQSWIIINLLPKIYERGIDKLELFNKNYNLLNKLFSKILDVDKNKKFIEEFIQNI